MENTAAATDHASRFILALGTLGGAALIVTISVTRRGPMVFLPYAALVLVSAGYLRYERVQPFLRRFNLALGAFMTATLILYLFIGIFPAKSLFKISVAGHAWRLGMMLGIGAILSAAVAQVSATREQRS